MFVQCFLCVFETLKIKHCDNVKTAIFFGIVALIDCVRNIFLSYSSKHTIIVYTYNTFIFNSCKQLHIVFTIKRHPIS